MYMLGLYILRCNIWLHINLILFLDILQFILFLFYFIYFIYFVYFFIIIYFLSSVIHFRILFKDISTNRTLNSLNSHALITLKSCNFLQKHNSLTHLYLAFSALCTSYSTLKRLHYIIFAL